MRELDWFVETLEQNHAIKVNRNQISYEGNELYLDEVDESFIPHEMAEALPKTLLFETMVFDDEDGTEWIGAIAFRPNSPDVNARIKLTVFARYDFTLLPKNQNKTPIE